MPHPNIRLLAFPIAAFCGLLLVAVRLDAVWIGGQGPITPCPAELTTATADLTPGILRGEIMTTGEGERAIYTTCEHTAYVLDERTQLELVSYQHDIPTLLNLRQGRIVVLGTADVKTRDVAVHVKEGTCEIVHYSWLDEVDIISHTPGACFVNGGPLFPVDHAVRLKTYNGDFLAEHPFDASASSAADFYAWAREQGYF